MNNIILLKQTFSTFTLSKASMLTYFKHEMRPIIFLLLYPSIKLSLPLLLGQLFFFASSITLALLRCSYCILWDLCGTSQINLLGKWLSCFRKVNRVCDFRLQQQQSTIFISWLKQQNLSTMSTLPTPRH